MGDGVDIDLYAEDIDNEFSHTEEFGNDNVDLYDDVIAAPGKPEDGVSRPNGSAQSRPSGETNGTGSYHMSQNNIGGHIGKRHHLYVGNLTWWTTDQDIANVIADVGVTDFIDVKFFENRANGQSKGFCLVALGTEHSMRLLIERLPKKELHGQHPVVTLPTKQALNTFESQSKTRPPPQSQQQQQGGGGGMRPPHPNGPPGPHPEFYGPPGGPGGPGGPPRMMMPGGGQGPPPPHMRPLPPHHMQGPPPPHHMQGPPPQQHRPPMQDPGNNHYMQQQFGPGGHMQGPRPGGPPGPRPEWRGPPPHGGPHGGIPHGGPPPPQYGALPPQHHMPPHHQMNPNMGPVPGARAPAPHVNPAFFPQPHPQNPQPPPQHLPPGGVPGPYAQAPARPAYPVHPVQRPPAPMHGQPPVQHAAAPPPQHVPPQQGHPHPQAGVYGDPAAAAIPRVSEPEFEEVMKRNRTVSSSAIARAVSDAAAGEYASAIETLVTAISLIKQSKVAHDDRCKILISSLQDTLHGVEAKSYRSADAGRSSRRDPTVSGTVSARSRTRSRDRERERDRGHHRAATSTRSSRRERSTSRDRYRERSPHAHDRYKERSRDRERERDASYYREYRDRERSRSRDREREHYNRGHSRGDERSRKSPVEPTAGADAPSEKARTAQSSSYYDDRYRERRH